MEPIEPGETILAFSGRETPTDDLDDATIAAGNWQGLAHGRALTPVSGPWEFPFPAHSEQPNALVMLHTRVVIATLPIEVSQEITVDYRVEPMDDRCRRLLVAPAPGSGIPTAPKSETKAEQTTSLLWP